MSFGGDCCVVLGERIELGRFKLLRFGTVLRDEWWEEPDVGQFIYRAGPWLVVGARPMSLPLRRRRRRHRWRRVASERLYCSFRPRRPHIIARDRPVPSTRTMSSSYRTIVPRAIYLARLPSITARAAVKDARRTAPTPCRRHVTRYALQSLLRIVVPVFRETVFRSIASERSRQCQSSR